MDIVLDTNVIQENFSLNSKKSILFLEFLRATGTAVRMPEIVIKEIIANYSKELISHNSQIEHSVAALNKLLIGEELKPPTFNHQLKTNDYKKHLLKKLRVGEIDIIKTKDEYMQDLISRCIERKKPFTENGEEFRDAILWLAVLDVAQQDKNKEVIFISNNSKQFGKEKSTLFKELLDESKKRCVTIHYHNNFSDFIEENCAISIEYINEQWIVDNLDIDSDLEEAQKDSEEWLVGDNIGTLRTPRTVKKIDDVKMLNYKIKNFTCYKLPNNEIYIDLNCSVEFEVSSTVEEVHREIEYDADGYPDSFTYTNTETDSYTTENEWQVEITVKDKEIIDAYVS